jgi:hypothetical protein
MIKHYCDNAEPITPKHITRAFKTSDNIFTILMRKGYITQVTTGRKKIFQWNRGTITESTLHEFYQDVLNYQREYLLKKHLDRKLEMTNRIQETLVKFEDSERKHKPKTRKRISILWGLITF